MAAARWPPFPSTPPKSSENTCGDRMWLGGADAVKHVVQVASKTPFYLYYAFNHVHTPQFAATETCGQSQRGIFGDSVEEVDHAVGVVMDLVRELKQQMGLEDPAENLTKEAPVVANIGDWPNNAEEEKEAAIIGSTVNSATAVEVELPKPECTQPARAADT